MKKIKTLAIIAMTVLSTLSVSAQGVGAVQHVESTPDSTNGILFLHDDFDGAMAKAKAENKKIFIDFYAVWCAPCKMMSKYVFTDSVLGDYFDSHYVALKLNTELAKNKSIVDKYEVTSMPALVFLDTAGNVIGRNNGSIDGPGFMTMAKTAAGEMKSFEQLYAEYKATPDDLLKAQSLLEAAPAYVTAQEGMDKQKWIIRIEKIYNTYVDKKMAMGDDFINRRDYKILSRFNHPTGEDDKVLNFMVKNIDKYIQALGKAPAYYIMETNTTLSQDYATKGNLKYKDAVERVKGDMAPVYSVAPKRKLSAYEISKASCDALYTIYKDQNVENYIKIKNEYFAAMDSTLEPMEKASAAQTIYYAAAKKVTTEQREVTRTWILSSLQRADQIPLLERVNIIVLLGDVDRNLKRIDEARKAYNQAYAECLQLKEERMKMMIQMQLKRRLELLKLE